MIVNQKFRQHSLLGRKFLSEPFWFRILSEESLDGVADSCVKIFHGDPVVPVQKRGVRTSIGWGEISLLFKKESVPILPRYFAFELLFLFNPGCFSTIPAFVYLRLKAWILLELTEWYANSVNNKTFHRQFFMLLNIFLQSKKYKFFIFLKIIQIHRNQLKFVLSPN